MRLPINNKLGRISIGFGAMATYWTKSPLWEIPVSFNVSLEAIFCEHDDEPKTKVNGLHISEDSIILQIQSF